MMSHQRKHITPAVPVSSVARSTLIKKLGGYGFTECASLINFLQLFCNEDFGVAELQYIRDKVRDVLSEHDNQSDYFTNLRQILKNTNDALVNCTRAPL